MSERPISWNPILELAPLAKQKRDWTWDEISKKWTGGKVAIQSVRYHGAKEIYQPYFESESIWPRKELDCVKELIVEKGASSFYIPYMEDIKEVEWFILQVSDLDILPMGWIWSIWNDHQLEMAVQFSESKIGVRIYNENLIVQYY